MYFGKASKLVGVTTLSVTPADNSTMQFGKPQRWSKQWTRGLVDQGRFQPVTLDVLRQCGVRHFCWLRPSEDIPGSDGKPLQTQPRLPLGGYAYLFHDDPLLETG